MLPARFPVMGTARHGVQTRHGESADTRRGGQVRQGLPSRATDQGTESRRCEELVVGIIHELPARAEEERT